MRTHRLRTRGSDDTNPETGHKLVCRLTLELLVLYAALRFKKKNTIRHEPRDGPQARPASQLDRSRVPTAAAQEY